MFYLDNKTNKIKQNMVEHTVGSFEQLISSPAWFDSVIVLPDGESSSFHLLEDLLCLKS